MDVAVVLGQLGGVAERSMVQRITSRKAVRKALRDGRIESPHRGVCALPHLDEVDRALARSGGVRSHLTAALHHGFPVKQPPPQPMVTVANTRRIARQHLDGITLHWAVLAERETSALCTSPIRTVIDCARDLPFDEALSVADSALRSGLVRQRDLVAAAEFSPRTGRARALAVAHAADARAANSFESVLRAIALEVKGLRVEPQLTIGTRDKDDLVVLGRVDLADLAAGLIIEAESWELHGGREAFRRDIRRYTAMVRAGWLVLRFGWDDVMHHPDVVREALVDTLACARGHRPEGLGHRAAA